MSARIDVFGPAYLDRVLRVDRPLTDLASGPPLDQSVDGAPGFGETGGLTLVDPGGCRLRIALPEGWPGPFGEVLLGSPALPAGGVAEWAVAGEAWRDDLGGMGAGFAAALGGSLVCALGTDEDPASQAVLRMLADHSIRHRPIRVAAHPADWTLLVTSGRHGDKLAVGFRGCHAALAAEGPGIPGEPSCDLRIVAALPNPLAARWLAAPGAECRMFAPTERNMRDRETPVSGFASSIDVLCCNRREWESLIDREEVAWRVSILAVTDGAEGSWVRFTRPDGEPGLVRTPAFPRGRPPRDTNRAGEAFAAELIGALLECGWSPGTGVVSVDQVQEAALRASAAAALVLDRERFGFPTAQEIHGALQAGRIA